jgi:AcrR family transcriptional regulator
MVRARAARVSADQRREEIISAAVVEFSQKGLHGGSTVKIAEEVGMSHPNLFRLFPTKKDLFIAAVERAVEQTAGKMVQKGQSADSDNVGAMKAAWAEAVADQTVMLMFLQGYAACQDEDIRAVMHRVSREAFTQIEAIPGMDLEEARQFYSRGMFYMIAAAMRFPALQDEDDWVRKFMG